MSDDGEDCKCKQLFWCLVKYIKPISVRFTGVNAKNTAVPYLSLSLNQVAAAWVGSYVYALTSRSPTVVGSTLGLLGLTVTVQGCPDWAEGEMVLV